MTSPMAYLRGTRAYELMGRIVPKSFHSTAKQFALDLESIALYGRRDMFHRVSIETISICNRRCGYCPIGDRDLREKRPAKTMDLELYSSILEQLSHIGYRGILSLSHYGEPLMEDGRGGRPLLEDRINEARQLLPKATIMFYSNGDYLSPDRLTSLIDAGVDRIVVTNHNQDGSKSPNLALLTDYLSGHPEVSRYLEFQGSIDRQGKVVSSRGGLVEVPDSQKRILDACIDESNALNIDVLGNVILCCEDFLGKYKFGNVGETPIMDIWDKRGFKKIREQNRRGDFRLDLCRECGGLE